MNNDDTGHDSNDLKSTHSKVNDNLQKNRNTKCSKDRIHKETNLVEKPWQLTHPKLTITKFKGLKVKQHKEMQKTNLDELPRKTKFIQ